MRDTANDPAEMARQRVEHDTRALRDLAMSALDVLDPFAVERVAAGSREPLDILTGHVTWETFLELRAAAERLAMGTRALFDLPDRDHTPALLRTAGEAVSLAAKVTRVAFGALEPGLPWNRPGTGPFGCRTR